MSLINRILCQIILRGNRGGENKESNSEVHGLNYSNQEALQASRQLLLFAIVEGTRKW